MEVVVPAIAGDVQEAEILALLVRVGQHVLAEQPVLELEAGKASFELPSPATGQIEEILVGIGDDVKVGDVVLTLRTVEDSERNTDSSPPSPSTASVLCVSRGPCVRASPAARRRAHELGVDLDALAAEVDGRVTVEQIEARAGADDDTSDPESAPLGAPPSRVGSDAPAGDQHSVPHAILHETVDITSLDAARRRHREREAEPRLTLASFVLKACAIALREHPRMNSSLIRQGRALAIKRYIHVGVAIDNGPAISVIKHVDRRSLRDLDGALATLQYRPRAPVGAPEQVELPTFSITHLRGFGGARFTPIIHPPQVGALGIIRAGREAGRTLLPISLAYDRRVNDDAAAAAFLAAIAELLHDPIAMLVRA